MPVQDSKVNELSRRELYEQVWSIPMARLCKLFNLSDVGLAKICDKHRIPCPPRGYWAKEQHGVQPISLPECDDPNLQVVRLPNKTKSPPKPRPELLEPEPDPDVKKILAKAEKLGRVRVKRLLCKPHPLVKATLDGLVEATPDSEGLLSPQRTGERKVMNIRVGPKSVMRAILFLDALLKAIGKIGGRIAIRPKPYDAARQETVVEMCGQVVTTIYLRERYFRYRKASDPNEPRWSWERYEFVPSGMLVLESYGPSCKDTEHSKRIEDGIGKVIIGWIKRLAHQRATEKREEAESRAREHAEQLRRKHEAEVKQRRNELRRKQKTEKSRVDKLLADSEAWQQSIRVRQFIRMIEGFAEREREQVIGNEADFASWLEWANQQADRLDPFTPHPHSVLDERI